MKISRTIVLVVLGFVFNGYAQNANYSQDFESFEKGTNLLKIKKKRFNSWGGATWTVSQTNKKGNNKSDKFATSGDKVNATLVQYHNLEVGKTYLFKVAVKITNAGGVNWKTNYAVKVISGAKGNTHIYGENNVKEPGENKWREHKIVFTVLEGKEKVALQVYRWAEGITLNVDDFSLTEMFGDN
tara:strand:- start:46214 stop:46768 length:555 start_codon:yes stop_codon:yes gene_type:complete